MIQKYRNIYGKDPRFKGDDAVTTAPEMSPYLRLNNFNARFD